MSVSPRVAFREGQRLYAADLTAEQEYRLGLAGRHFLAAHGWGIVSLTAPSYAIDGYGRELMRWSAVAPGESAVSVFYCEDNTLSRIKQRSISQAGADGAETQPSAPRENERTLLASAAGAFLARPPWPVQIRPAKRFTSLGAAAVTGIARSTRVQIGPASSSDPFCFVIWQDPNRRRLATGAGGIWF